MDSGSINLEILKLTGGTRTADLVLWSFDTTQVEPLIAADDWRGIGKMLQDAIDRMMACEVEGLIIASNTIHRVLEQNHLKLPLPFVDIRDSLLNELSRQNITRVGFVGTSATMNGDIYRHLSSEGGTPHSYIALDGPDHRHLRDEMRLGYSRQLVADVVPKLVEYVQTRAWPPGTPTPASTNTPRAGSCSAACATRTSRASGPSSTSPARWSAWATGAWRKRTWPAR